METNRRTFLMLALAGAVVCGSWGVSAAENATADAGGDVARVTLDVQGMH